MTLVLETNLPNLYYRGKVRDTYELGGHLLMVATDRISAFDVVLPTGIPDKGIVLAKLSAFWFGKTASLVPNHFIAMAHDFKEFDEGGDLSLLTSLPQDVAQRAMMVKKAKRIDVECIVRGYLAGSAWAEYTEKGTIGGKPMKRGLRESEKLPEPLFTPTTKATTGHDENMTIEEMGTLIGQDLTSKLREITMAIYNYANEYALTKGIILADTKMEFGLLDGEVILIDELLTPDSSRFWDAERYESGRPQPNFDKQFVRDWLIQSCWNKEPPAPALPPDIVSKTSERYKEAHFRLTGAAI